MLRRARLAERIGMTSEMRMCLLATGGLTAAGARSRRDARRGRQRRQWGARAPPPLPWTDPRHRAGRARVRRRSCSKDSTPKSRRRARFPFLFQPLFKRERGTCSGGRVPQGRAYEARCQATRPRRNPLEVSARRCRFTSPRRGFLEGNERRIPPRLGCVSRPWLAPRKVFPTERRCRDFH